MPKILIKKQACTIGYTLSKKVDDEIRYSQLLIAAKETQQAKTKN